MAKPKKVPPLPQTAPQKIPRWLGPQTFEGHHTSWRFCMADQAGDWPWHSIPDDRAGEVLKKLAEFETLDQKSLHKVRHRHNFGSLPKKTQERLREIEKDDADYYLSFHVSGASRIWCLPYGGTMCVLWWDQEHQVYPTFKHNT